MSRVDGDLNSRLTGYAGYEYETTGTVPGMPSQSQPNAEADAVAERYRVGPTIRRFPQLSPPLGGGREGGGRGERRGGGGGGGGGEGGGGGGGGEGGGQRG